MKYSSHAVAMSLDEREQWNKTIAAAIEDGSIADLDKEEVFNRYTGKGRLHGLNRADYRSYYDYSEAKKEHEQGQFYTPAGLCETIVAAINPPKDFIIADLSCGTGNFFNYLSPETNLYGNEIDETACRIASLLYPSANISCGDFIYYEPQQKFDVIIGNPPFNIRTDKGISQWKYIRKSHDLLQYGGLLAVIVPASFLDDELQDKRRINWLNEHFNFIIQARIPDNSFDAVIDTKLLVIQKKGVTNSDRKFNPCYIPFDRQDIYSQYIQPLHEQYKKDAAKRHLLNVQDSVADRELQYKINKYIWHIKSSPVLHSKYYVKALKKVQQLKTQKKPNDISEKEWELIKLTPEKVCSILYSVIRNQNAPKPKKICKLVKTNYGLRYKAYHKKLQHKNRSYSVHQLLTKSVDLGKLKNYSRLYKKKKAALDKQNIPFTEMQRDPEVDMFLDGFRLVPFCPDGMLFPVTDAPEIMLNGMQKQDLGLLLQKRYGLLSWEQGGGKSVAGMTWLRYWQGKYRNCFLVAPSIAINTTWKERLSAYGFDHLHLERIADIAKIKRGQVILLTYDGLVSLQRHIKAYVKRQSYKVALLVDESDEMTNAGSQRSRAALNCFRKAKLKLLTTGTTTRNSINEIFTQLELLYNNSSAFICWANTVYHVNKENEIEEELNCRRGLPFPAFRGAGLFKACFNPQKSTVFGIKKENQDIYNAEVLKDIIAKTIITRKFEEIVGEKKYSIHTHQVAQSENERGLYKLLLTEFLKVCYDFYSSTGNTRKEAAMRLIRQIKVLIKATSIPHLMQHYSGNELPAKYHKVFGLLNQWQNERVTIGCIFKKAARDYRNELIQRFPDRRTFYIDGEMSIGSRKRELERFRASGNGILVCTQQALKSSVNIPYCNRCIIEALQWNIPKISQFYFRFIRFDSIRHTQVHFVNYEDTIELNLLALLMAKEKLNDFIKTTNETTTENVYREFGVDLSILDTLIQKEYDNEGKLHLTWGRQQLHRA